MRTSLMSVSFSSSSFVICAQFTKNPKSSTNLGLQVADSLQHLIARAARSSACALCLSARQHSDFFLCVLQFLLHSLNGLDFLLLQRGDRVICDDRVLLQFF